MLKNTFFHKKMCVLKPDLVNQVVSNNLSPKLNSLVLTLYVKNLCFETRFRQLSGIQQFILSWLIEIHHFRKITKVKLTLERIVW